MTTNLPVQQHEDRNIRNSMEKTSPNRSQLVRTLNRALPVNAYIRPGLGDLPLSTQLRSALGLFEDLLLPLVDAFEAKQPVVLECSVCRRNLGGWPQQVLEDHYWQHTWLQRKLASIGIR